MFNSLTDGTSSGTGTSSDPNKIDSKAKIDLRAPAIIEQIFEVFRNKIEPSADNTSVLRGLITYRNGVGSSFEHVTITKYQNGNYDIETYNPHLEHCDTLCYTVSADGQVTSKFDDTPKTVKNDPQLERALQSHMVSFVINLMAHYPDVNCPKELTELVKRITIPNIG